VTRVRAGLAETVELGRIRSLETFHDRYVCFVRLTTTLGHVGWGQTSTYNADNTARIFHRQVAPWAIGAETSDIGGLITRIEERELKYPGSYRCRALAGLDTALWDLHGRATGRPAVELLGGQPGRLRAYASSMRRDVTPRQDAQRLGRLRDDFGFDAFKWRVGAECGHDVDRWPGRAEEIVPAVARALGDGVARLVDANGGFSPDRAIEVGRLLEAEGVGHFEEPAVARRSTGPPPAPPGVCDHRRRPGAAARHARQPAPRAGQRRRGVSVDPQRRFVFELRGLELAAVAEDVLWQDSADGAAWPGRPSAAGRPQTGVQLGLIAPCSGDRRRSREGTQSRVTPQLVG
jgi:hypothetical protein